MQVEMLQRDLNQATATTIELQLENQRLKTQVDAKQEEVLHLTKKMEKLDRTATLFEGFPIRSSFCSLSRSRV